MISKVLLLVDSSSFCSFAAFYQKISYPTKGAICGMLDRLIEEIREDRNKSQSGKCRPPCFDSRTRGLGEKSSGLSHSGVDGQRGESPVIGH